MYKKGDRWRMENDQEIAFLDVSYKLLARLIPNR